MLYKYILLYLILLLWIIPNIAAGLTVEEQDKIISKLQSAYSKGGNAYKEKKYKKAAENWEEALKALKKLIQVQVEESKKLRKIKEGLLLNIGEAYRKLAKKEGADSNIYFIKAKNKFEEIEFFVGVSKEKVNLSLCLLYKDRGQRFIEIGQYIKAKENHEKALDFSKLLPKSISKNEILRIIANQHRSIGISEKYLGNYNSALNHFNKAFHLWQKVADKKEQLNERANIALLQIDMGQILESIYKLDSLIKEDTERGLPIAHNYLNLGKCYYILGDYGEAESKFLRAEYLYKELNNARGKDVVNINLGLIDYEQGLFDDALHRFKMAAKSKDKQLQTISLSNAGAVYINYFMENHQYPYLKKAENELHKAEVVADAIADKRMLMSISNNMGKVYYERGDSGDYKNANHKLDLALKYADELYDKGTHILHEYSNICSCKGDVYLKQGDFNNATHYFDKAVKNAKKGGKGEILFPDFLNQLWYGYYGLGRAYKAIGNIKEAIENFESSIDVIKDMRSLIGGSGSIGFLRNKHQVYTDLIDLLLEQWEKEKDEKKKNGYSTDALIILERSRLGALKSLFEQATPKQNENIEIALNEITHQLEKATNPKKINKLKRKKDEFDRRIEKDDPLIQKSNFDKDKFFFEIIKNMNPKQVIFEYYHNDKNIYVWKLDKECKSPHFYPPINIRYEDKDGVEYNILKRIDRLYEIISDKNKLFSEDKGQLWSNFYKKDNENYIGHLIEIISDKIFPFKIDDNKYDVVTIIPYGKLCLLPFSILGDKDHRLIDRNFYTNYYYSMKQALLANTKPEGHNLFAVGNPEIPGFISKTSSTTRGMSLDNRASTGKDKPKFKEARDILAKLKNMGLLKETEDGKAGIGRSKGFERLKDAGDEVRSIEETFKKTFKDKSQKHYEKNIRLTIRSDEKVGEDFIKNNITKNYNYLHFATHGLLVSSSPLDSFLVFSEREVDPSKCPNDSGLLTVKEIRKNFFKKLNKTRLATLSACQTSLAFGTSGTQSALGLEFASLSGAFQSAGVNTVIASLWEVHSEVTAEIMKRFYHYLIEKGQPIGKALKSAQEEFRKNEDIVLITYYEEGKEKEDESKRDKEYLWAPFIVLGNPY